MPPELGEGSDDEDDCDSEDDKDYDDEDDVLFLRMTVCDSIIYRSI